MNNKNINSTKISSELIAPCGINCRICIGYLGYLMNGGKRKHACSGCRPKDKSCSWVKKQCSKLANHELEYCFQCDDFPCDIIKKLDRNYRQKYNMSTIANLKFIMKNGISPFLQQQAEQYTCPNCGHLICVHTQKCYNCGAEYEL